MRYIVFLYSPHKKMMIARHTRLAERARTRFATIKRKGKALARTPSPQPRPLPASKLVSMGRFEIKDPNLPPQPKLELPVVKKVC